MSTLNTPLSKLTDDAVDFAEALGVILGAKLHDIVRDTISSEVQLWRTDALRILTELREDIQIHVADSGIQNRVEPSIFGKTMSDASSRTLTRARSRNTTSLEQRLAADIFEAKLGLRSRAQTRKDSKSQQAASSTSHPLATSHEGVPPLAMRQIVPVEQANVDHLPSQLMCCDSEDGSVRPQCPSEREYEQVISESDDFTSRACVPLHSNVSQDAQAVERFESFGEHFRSHTSTTSSKRNIRWKSQASKFFYDRTVVIDESWRPARTIISIFFRAIGLSPQGMHFTFRSRVYQFVVFCCLVFSTLSVIFSKSLSNSLEGRTAGFTTLSDEILAVGALLSFSAALWNAQALHDTSWLIESYLSRGDRLEEANKKSCFDIAMMFGLWALCVGARFYSLAFKVRLHDFAFAFYILILLAICNYALRVCRCLFYMVDYFCDAMQDNEDSKTALEEFFLLHCILRTACNSVQLCFVVLQLTGTVLFLVGSTFIYFGATSTDVILASVIPLVVCELVIVHLSIRGGLVSDLCARVPMLVSSSSATLKMERMYLLDYIVFCSSGFYIFEVRLNTATVLKLGYVAFVAWCGVLTQGLL